MAACAIVKVVASHADNIVGVFEERSRIDEQAERLKKWRKAQVTAPVPRVITEEIKEDWQDVERGRIDDDSHYDCYRAYSAQRIADVEGREFAGACDRCHVCGAPDPESRAAQYRMRQRLGVTGVSETLVKAQLESMKKTEEENGSRWEWDTHW